MPDAHGKLFDTFTRTARHSHGARFFDVGFSPAEHDEAHGKLYDLFGAERGTDLHGSRFDEFGWKDMPTLHGEKFDEGFAEHTAHDSGEHGTWFDEFRGGAEVRFMLDGADYEGTVVQVNPDHVVVRSHDGQTLEVGLQQFLAYRTPTQQQEAPGLPGPAVDSPSAHNPVAHGASGTRGTPTGSELPSKIQTVAPGGSLRGRTDGIPAGLMDTFTHLKSLAADLDVEKDVDATETAAQGDTRQDAPDGAWCPACKHECKKVTADGRCPTCGGKAEVGKSTGDLGIDVPEREHPSTDHHTDGKGPRTCPHCGKVLEQVAEATEAGHPRRQSKQGQRETWSSTHKCVGTGLDVLKTLVEA